MMMNSMYYDEEFTKERILQLELLSDEKLWFRVGTVFNVFMRPLFSGQIMVIPQYFCDRTGLSGVKDNSILRNNMLAVYNSKTQCIQDELNLNLKNITIKIHSTKCLLEMTAPNAKRLILNVNNIVKDNTGIVCLKSFNEKFTVYVHCINCGEEAAAWISRHLNNPDLQLAYIMPKENSKYTFWHDMEKLQALQYNNTNFALPANVVPNFKLISYQSYIEVNKLLNCPVTIDKYNADICIIPKKTESFAELEWEWIKIGDIILRNINPLKRHSIKINVNQLPIEMKMKMMVLNCELYQSGTMQSGDDVYVHLRPKDSFEDFPEKEKEITFDE